MNKLEANISLFIITFFASIQYIFLASIPSSVSTFAFLAVTNLIGFLIALALFWSELFRLDRKQILQSVILSAELVVMNVFLLLGSSGMRESVISCVVCVYFVFIPPLSMIFLKEKYDRFALLGTAVALTGVLLITNQGIAGLWNVHVLYLVLFDVVFAAYLITVGTITVKSNPSILVMGQMFFSAIFSLMLWAAEAFLKHAPMTLPADPKFWGAVLFISFFIRGLYGVVQLYAQRYVSALNTSLIFASEIVITMAVSPIISPLLGTEAEPFTLLKLLGAVLVVSGILLADSTVVSKLKRRPAHEKD